MNNNIVEGNISVIAYIESPTDQPMCLSSEYPTKVCIKLNYIFFISSSLVCNKYCLYHQKHNIKHKQWNIDKHIDK